MSDREHIPNELQRQLMLEVGYRCPLCKATEPLEFEHIEEWAEVKKHEFTNMIVLCASCHGRKRDTSNPRHINRASLRALKQNLMLLNGRYSDLERRVLEAFQEEVKAKPQARQAPLHVLPDTMVLLVRRLAEDGLAVVERRKLTTTYTFTDGFEYHEGIVLIELTEAGRKFVENLIAVTAV